MHPSIQLTAFDVKVLLEPYNLAIECRTMFADSLAPSCAPYLDHRTHEALPHCLPYAFMVATIIGKGHLRIGDVFRPCSMAAGGQEEQ